MALTGGMSGWVGWLAGCVVAVVARCLHAGLVDWRGGYHAHLTQYLSDKRGGDVQWVCAWLFDGAFVCIRACVYARVRRCVQAVGLACVG